MFPSISPSQLCRPRYLFAVALTVNQFIAPLAFSDDFNADYPMSGDATNSCAYDCGGVGIAATGTFTASETYISINGVQYFNFTPLSKNCSTVTLVSLAVDNKPENPCIRSNDLFHVGFSTGGMSQTVLSAILYNNDMSTSTADPMHCRLTKTLEADANCLPINFAERCPLPMPRPRMDLAAQVEYRPLSATAWQVHADGKTLTVFNGLTFPEGRPCPATAYVGNVRFGYYATRQPLRTLNADSLREPLDFSDIEDTQAIPCNDSLTVSVVSNPPEGAKYVVMSATADTIPSLDGPGASHIWIQEAIVRDGEHVIETNAGPHGTIDPLGPIVLPNGANQTFTITPAAGYRVADVLVDHLSVGASTVYKFSNVTTNHRIDVSFVLDNTPPDCHAVKAVPAVLWPPNHKLVSVHLEGLTDPDGDSVTARITRVTQDEPLSAGAHDPDAIVDETDHCLLRAERDGNGNGRVYRLWYVADDGRGGECKGSVRVCVPHDPAHPDCIDDGPVVPENWPHSADRDPLARVPEIGRTSIASGRATVEYSLPSQGIVQLALYDVVGRRVATIDSGTRGEGVHQTPWDARGLASGIYFYRLRIGAEVVSRTVLIR